MIEMRVLVKYDHPRGHRGNEKVFAIKIVFGPRKDISQMPNPLVIFVAIKL